MSDQERDPDKDSTHSNPVLTREDIPELVQLIVREVAKNVGTGSLKDAGDPREGPSRSEDDDGEWLGLRCMRSLWALASNDVVW